MPKEKPPIFQPVCLRYCAKLRSIFIFWVFGMFQVFFIVDNNPAWAELVVVVVDVDVVVVVVVVVDDVVGVGGGVLAVRMSPNIGTLVS